ncbi:single-stranded DNA-binding protein [Pandoraea cepalis]|nr:single-stranded DNA-binding protein [Pandoraea cepalis]
MSKFINRVILRGRVATQPALRFLPSDAPVCTFQLATPDGSNHTEFHKLVGYYERALEAAQYFEVGDVIYVEGHIRTRQFQTEEDKQVGRTKKRSVIEIVADDWVLCSKAGADAKKNAGAGDDAGVVPSLEPMAVDRSDGAADEGSAVPFL